MLRWFPSHLSVLGGIFALLWSIICLLFLVFLSELYIYPNLCLILDNYEMRSRTQTARVSGLKHMMIKAVSSPLYIIIIQATLSMGCSNSSMHKIEAVIIILGLLLGTNLCVYGTFKIIVKRLVGENSVTTNSGQPITTKAERMYTFANSAVNIMVPVLYSILIVGEGAKSKDEHKLRIVKMITLVFWLIGFVAYLFIVSMYAHRNNNSVDGIVEQDLELPQRSSSSSKKKSTDVKAKVESERLADPNGYTFLCLVDTKVILYTLVLSFFIFKCIFQCLIGCVYLVSFTEYLSYFIKYSIVSFSLPHTHMLVLRLTMMEISLLDLPCV